MAVRLQKQQLPGAISKPKYKIKNIIPEKNFLYSPKKLCFEKFLYSKMGPDLAYYPNVSENVLYFL